jgi:integrase
MIETGLRRFEIAQMTLDGTNLDGYVIRIVGKRGREAVAFFAVKTARDLDRYLGMRVHHIHGRRPAFWLIQETLTSWSCPGWRCRAAWSCPRSAHGPTPGEFYLGGLPARIRHPVGA